MNRILGIDNNFAQNAEKMFLDGINRLASDQTNVLINGFWLNLGQL